MLLIGFGRRAFPLLLAGAVACGSDGLPPTPPDAPTIDLSLRMIVSAATPLEGDTVRFTLTARNLGPRNATEVGVGDTLPTGLTFVRSAASRGSYSHTPGTSNFGIWAIGALALGDSATLTIDARVASGTAGQTLRNRALVASLALRDSVPTNNRDSADVRPRTAGGGNPPPPVGATEPAFRSGVDQLIIADNFDGFASPDARHQELLRLRQAQGVNSHSLFISDNRPVDNPPASYYELHQVVSPGRGGAGRALRSRYLDDPNNQGSTWRTWPAGNFYTPDTATTVVSVWMRVVSVGWQINFPGWKHFEFWHPGGSSRTQISVIGPAGQERFSVNPASRGEFGNQIATARPRWNEINDGQWHRMTYVYRPGRTDNDTTGVVRLFVDGSKVIDISMAGVREGFSTLADVRSLTALKAAHIQWPDILNTNAGRGVGVIDYDDLTWFVQRGP